MNSQFNNTQTERIMFSMPPNQNQNQFPSQSGDGGGGGGGSMQPNFSKVLN